MTPPSSRRIRKTGGEQGTRGAKLKYAHPLGIDDVATDFPTTRIVIAHMGYPWHRDAAEVCYKNDNVFADVSGFVYGEFGYTEAQHFKCVMDEFIEVAGGSRQLLFGSDWPISDQTSYTATLSQQFMLHTIDENSRRAFDL